MELAKVTDLSIRNEENIDVYRCESWYETLYELVPPFSARAAAALATRLVDQNKRCTRTVLVTAVQPSIMIHRRCVALVLFSCFVCVQRTQPVHTCTHTHVEHENKIYDKNARINHTTKRVSQVPKKLCEAPSKTEA
jgi:hypothetical protein